MPVFKSSEFYRTENVGSVLRFSNFPVAQCTSTVHCTVVQRLFVYVRDLLFGGQPSFLQLGVLCATLCCGHCNLYSLVSSTESHSVG